MAAGGAQGGLSGMFLVSRSCCCCVPTAWRALPCISGSMASRSYGSSRPRPAHRRGADWYRPASKDRPSAGNSDQFRPYLIQSCSQPVTDNCRNDGALPQVAAVDLSNASLARPAAAILRKGSVLSIQICQAKGVNIIKAVNCAVAPPGRPQMIYRFAPANEIQSPNAYCPADVALPSTDGMFWRPDT